MGTPNWTEAQLKVRNITDIEQFERVPLEDWRLPGTVYEAIQQRARLQPDATAIRFVAVGDAPEAEQVVSYADLLSGITRVANYLRHLGVGPQDAVGLLVPNVPDAHICLWAAQTAGIACPINYMLEPVQVSSILREAKCKVLVAVGPHASFDIWDKCDGLDAPDLQTIILIDAGYAEGQPLKHADRSAPRGVSIVPLAASAEFASDALSFALQDETPPARVAAIFHTGGTTGDPKLALQTHANQIGNCWLQSVCLDMPPGHVRLCGLPLFHVNGALANGLALFMAGATLVLTGARGYRDPGVLRNFWWFVEHYRANSLAAVPTFLVSLIQVPVDGRDISSLEFVRCGTAPLSRQLARDFTAVTGVEVIEGYGLTEATSISAMNPRFGEKRIGSVGLRLPYQAVDVRGPRTAPDAGAPRGTGQLGVVHLRGPNVIPGYRDDRATASEFSADGWYNTGDIGRLDAEGYLWLAAREKDIIIRAGHNLDPRMIEEAFQAHPAVAQAAAVGQPDRYTGEMPVVYLTLKPGSTVDSETLLRFAAERIPERAAVPKQVRILRELPLTAVGKVSKVGLRKLAARTGYLEALGGMPGAYNMAMTVDDASGETTISLTCTNLSPALHASVKRFVGDALKTFTFWHEISFVERI